MVRTIAYMSFSARGDKKRTFPRVSGLAVPKESLRVEVRAAVHADAESVDELAP